MISMIVTSWVVNHSSLKGLELLSTFPEGNGCHNANENRKGDIVVGSALRKSLSKGQPVISKNDVKTNIDIAAIARGTIHLNPEGVEFSLPLDPDAITDQMYQAIQSIACPQLYTNIAIS